jgi:hypothetical protein
MKTLVAAFALASLVATSLVATSLVATSAWARTESVVAARAGLPTFSKAERAAARQPAQSYALVLGVGF